LKKRPARKRPPAQGRGLSRLDDDGRRDREKGTTSMNAADEKKENRSHEPRRCGSIGRDGEPGGKLGRAEAEEDGPSVSNMRETKKRKGRDRPAPDRKEKKWTTRRREGSEKKKQHAVSPP